MKDYRFRSDLVRAVIDGFALPLGFEPGGYAAPQRGYTVSYNSGEEDDPDTYTFQVVVSCEDLPALCRRCFELLPDQVYAIIEIGSRDAYRTVDVFLGAEPIPVEEFQEVWRQFEDFLLEDGSIAAGANAEDPFVEIFIDQRKTVVIHAPLDMREDVERLLQGEFRLQEVDETWPEMPIDDDAPEPRIRPVLDVSDSYLPDVDEILLQLRHHWQLELNLDPEANQDEAGRHLGMTLWHTVVIVYRTDDPDGAGAYMTIWLTAGSLSQAERLLMEQIDGRPDWEFGEIYTIDRVAFDERPDELADLAPRRDEADVHLVSLEPWPDPPEESGAADSA